MRHFHQDHHVLGRLHELVIVIVQHAQHARPAGLAEAWKTGRPPAHPALDALARLSAAGDLLLGENTKFAGMFRAHGLLVPVWDVPGEPEAAEFEAPLADFAKRYQDILAETGPLDAAARRAKQGLVGRQLTLR
jgi:hypothetical protein